MTGTSDVVACKAASGGPSGPMHRLSIRFGLPVTRAAVPAQHGAPQESGCDLPIEVLEEVVCCELDLLVTPLGCPVVAGDQPHSMHAAEVAVHERVPGLRLLGGAFGEAEVPGGVFLPGVGLEERVLLACARLDVLPAGAEDVLACVDQFLRMPDGVRVQTVRGQGLILADGTVVGTDS